MKLMAEHFGKNCEIVLHDFMAPDNHTIIGIENGEVTGRAWRSSTENRRRMHSIMPPMLKMGIFCGLPPSIFTTALDSPSVPCASTRILRIPRILKRCCGNTTIPTTMKTGKMLLRRRSSCRTSMSCWIAWSTSASKNMESLRSSWPKRKKFSLSRIWIWRGPLWSRRPAIASTRCLGFPDTHSIHIWSRGGKCVGKAGLL